MQARLKCIYMNGAFIIQMHLYEQITEIDHTIENFNICHVHKKIDQIKLKDFTLQPNLCDSVLPYHCLPLDTGMRTMVRSKVSVYWGGRDFNLSLQSQRKNETLFSIVDLLFKT